MDNATSLTKRFNAILEDLYKKAYLDGTYAATANDLANEELDELNLDDMMDSGLKQDAILTAMDEINHLND